MITKCAEKERAVALRRQGKTYGEILEEVSVAKSTLSLWLRDVGLSKRQEQKISQKRQAAQKRGALSQKAEKQRRLMEADSWATQYVSSALKDPLMLAGVMLYWAEGSKEYSWSKTTTLEFINSDAKMVQLYVVWLRQSLNIPMSEIVFTVVIQETYKKDVERFLLYWSRVVNVSPDSFRVFYKKGNTRTIRKNIGRSYYGCLRVCVKKSSVYNRRVTALSVKIAEVLNCRVV